AGWLIPALMFCTGCCFGFAVSPSQTANMATVSAAQTGHGSTLLNTLRQAGSAAGVALLGTVLTTSQASQADLAGFRVAFATAAVLMLLALMLSLFVRDADAAASMGDVGPGEPATAPWPEAA
ncbi:MAG TPA: hypothetical protein VI365_19755, partial [Trebonia sp.]